MQHGRLFCPSPIPGACSNSCPLGQWFHPIISSSVVPSSSCLQFFPASGSFPVLTVRWPKYCSFSTHRSREYSGLISFRIDWLAFLEVQGTSKSLLQRPNLKASILQCSAFFMVQLSYPHMTTGKTMALTKQTFVGKAMCLLFNTLSRLVIAFLPRSKCLNFTAAVNICSDFGTQENKLCHCFHCFPIYLSWSDGTRCHDLHFWTLSFKPSFSHSSFNFIKRLFSSFSLSAIRVVSSVYLRLLIFLPAILILAWASPSQHFAWCTPQLS